MLDNAMIFGLFSVGIFCAGLLVGCWITRSFLMGKPLLRLPKLKKDQTDPVREFGAWKV